MAGATTPPVTPKVTVSVDPLWKQALTQAKTTLTPQIQTIQDEQTASDATSAQRQTDATNVASALSDLLKGIGPQVNAEYQTAAQNQELAANGFSQGMQDALQGNTDNLNSMLQKLGSPAQLDSHAKQAGDVLYGLGGFNPGKTFSEQGAAFGAAADLKSADALLQGGQNVQALKIKALQDDVGFQNKIAEIAAKLPGDTQTNYTKLQSLAIANKRFAEQVKNDKFNQAYKTASIKLQTAKYNTSIDEFNARQQLDYTKLARQQFQQDRQYTLSLNRLGISQANLQLRVAATAFKAAHGGFTPAQLTKLQGQSLAMSQSALNGSTSYVMKNGAKVPVHSGGIPFFEALTLQLKKGIPVQTALSSLDRVYPSDARPTDESLQNYLGPLTPAALAAQIKINAGTPAVAGLAMTSPTSLAMGATARGLDPQAVLAVASMEGLSGGVGDGGHAFGPFQLNNAGGVITGMFPGATTQQINDWAWSPAGINFALDHIAQVAKGLTGRAAIEAIVRQFERPLAPNPEVAGAVARYGG